MKTKYILNLLAIFLLQACNNLHTEHITERYFLVVMDGSENICLSYSVNDDNSSFVDLISEKVSEIGYNESFIIAKQNPINKKNIVNYYIVRIYKKFTPFPEKGIIGPLTYEQFNEKKKEMKIDDISFTKVIN